MRHTRYRVAALVAATSLAVSGLAAISANADTASTASVERAARVQAQSVTDYWTVDRVESATPREVVIDDTDQNKVKIQTTTPKATIQATNERWTKGGDVLKTTGKILFQMKRPNPKPGDDPLANFVCSASVIKEQATGKSVVLTAGHCVFDQENREYARYWVFVPDFDSQPVKPDKNLNFCSQVKYGCWTSASFFATDMYRNGKGLEAQAGDYAFVTFGKGGKEWRELDEVAGGQEIAFKPSNGVGYSFGYPAGKPYNGLELTYSTDRIGGGAQGIYNIQSQMTGGCSGGPWFINFSENTGRGTLHSVNSFGFKSDDGKPDRKMYGPVLDSTAEGYYKQALAATPKPGIPVPGPTSGPTSQPTKEPTNKPTVDPTVDPTSDPTDQPTDQPTSNPGDGTFSNNQKQAINDYGTAKSSITSTFPNAKRLTLSIDINHTCLQNLEITVVSPDGSRNVVKRAEYGSRCDAWSGVKSDSFDMRSKSNGQWTIEVRDAVRGHTGTLNGWSIKLS